MNEKRATDKNTTHTAPHTNTGTRSLTQITARKHTHTHATRARLLFSRTGCMQNARSHRPWAVWARRAVARAPERDSAFTFHSVPVVLLPLFGWVHF